MKIYQNYFMEEIDDKQCNKLSFLILNFCRVLNVVCFFLGDSLASVI
jgi:hypothetical protein